MKKNIHTRARAFVGLLESVNIIFNDQHPQPLNCCTIFLSSCGGTVEPVGVMSTNSLFVQFASPNSLSTV